MLSHRDNPGRDGKGRDLVWGSLGSLAYKNEREFALFLSVSLGSTPSSSSSFVANLLGNNIPYCYFICYPMGTIRDGTGRDGTGFGVHLVHYITRMKGSLLDFRQFL